MTVAAAAAFDTRPLRSPSPASKFDVEPEIDAQTIIKMFLGQSQDAIVVAQTYQRTLLHVLGKNLPAYLRGLSDEAVAELHRRWRHPCADMFDYLAANLPSDLLAMIRTGGLDDVQLTLAAERVVEIGDHSAARAALLPLLSHPEATVREGAVYGLHDHVDDEARAILTRLALTDSSDGVRQAAVDALQER